MTILACGRVQGCGSTQSGDPPYKRQTYHLTSCLSERKGEITRNLTARASLTALIFKAVTADTVAEAGEGCGPGSFRGALASAFCQCTRERCCPLRDEAGELLHVLERLIF